MTCHCTQFSCIAYILKSSHLWKRREEDDDDDVGWILYSWEEFELMLNENVKRITLIFIHMLEMFLFLLNVNVPRIFWLRVVLLCELGCDGELEILEPLFWNYIESVSWKMYEKIIHEFGASVVLPLVILLGSL